MDSRVFCVYNLARRVFLSSKVVVADVVNQPLKVLNLLVSGPGLDAKSGLWLTPLDGDFAVPRVIPFDLIYLDANHRIAEIVEVTPSVKFPAHRRDFASALILPL